MNFEQCQQQYQDILNSLSTQKGYHDQNYKLPLSDAIFCAEDVRRNRKFWEAIRGGMQRLKSGKAKRDAVAEELKEMQRLKSGKDTEAKELKSGKAKRDAVAEELKADPDGSGRRVVPKAEKSKTENGTNGKLNKLNTEQTENGINGINGTLTVDAGAGMGIFGLYALIHGAEHCIFIEQNPHTMKLCQEVIFHFGYQDHATFLQQNATNVQLDVKRDMLITETISSDARTEDIHRIINHLRQFQAPGGIIIPEGFGVELKSGKRCRGGRAEELNVGMHNNASYGVEKDSKGFKKVKKSGKGFDVVAESSWLHTMFCRSGTPVVLNKKEVGKYGKGLKEVENGRKKWKSISTYHHIPQLTLPKEVVRFRLQIKLYDDIRIRPGECMSLCGDPEGKAISGPYTIFPTTTLVMAGGGSGGHVRPIETLIRYIDQYAHPDIDRIIRYGSANSFEEEVSRTLQQELQHITLTFVPISSGKLRRETSIQAWGKNIRDIFRFLRGIRQTRKRTKRDQVRSIFCKGGFVALPVVIAGWLKGIPIIVHESDTHPGLVNRIASKFAKKVFCGFPHVLGGEHVGQILSSRLFANLPKTTSSKTHILVTGGSLGAKSLYEAMKFVLDRLTQQQQNHHFHFTIVGGLLNTEIDFSSYPSVEYFDFVSPQQMGKLYHQADLCILRAGTTTLAETKLFGCKNIIVPLPCTHDQAHNAKYYTDHYHDIVLDQDYPDFHQRLLEHVLAHRGYNKQPPHVDSKTVLNTPSRIVDSLVECVK